MAPSPARLLAVFSLALAAAPARTAEPAAGRLDMDDAQVEVLSQPLPAGRRIELPEGFLQVEEDGPEDGDVGTFTVASAAAVTPAATAAPPASEDQALPAPPPPAFPPAAAPGEQASPCRAERTAYLRELWRESGIDLDDPVALAEGLESGAAGPATAYGWFALQVDAFRNLSWSEDLKARARDVVRCVNEHQG
jgi:AcrR family transcriptional regulator